MKIVIIEDEPLTAKDLAACIVAAEPSAEIVASLASVQEATAYFKANEAPDMIFSDIQLGDGKSFSVFEHLMRTIPVIFCTAYDAYALEAFRAAGIDYILKPFTEKSIAGALAKYRAFRGAHVEAPKGAAGKMEEVAGIGAAGASGRGASGRMSMAAASAILVFYKEKILPVKVGDIALFYLQKEVVRLMTFDKKEYIVNKSLDELEGLVTSSFYRVNRQHLVNREAIRDVSQYFGRKLLVNLSLPFEEKVTVGRVKVNHFLAWLSGS